MVIILLDAGACADCFNQTFGQLYPPILDSVDFSSQRVVFALNKVDVLNGMPADKRAALYNSITASLGNIAPLAGKVNLCPVSALTGNGVDTLLKTLSDYAKSRLSTASDGSVLVTNIRHWEALVTAQKALLGVKSGLASGTPTDLVAEDLRSALSTLGTITGEITHTEILQNIFGKFCIGK